ncbi:MAG: winged helix-turn-helix domain-containing protein [Candidatus Bathyarchaeia archaeon]
METDIWYSSLSQRRRDKLYIIAEILEIAGDGALKTQIMYRANLSFTQLNEYLKFMLKIRFLDMFIKDGKEFYKATEKGLDFLQKYREITDLLKTENENVKTNIKVPPPHLLRRN